MEKMSDKGPIFARENDPRDMVLQTLGAEFVWAFQELVPELWDELTKTWGAGKEGAEQVRAMCHSMARKCFGVVAENPELLRSTLVILREARNLLEMCRGS